jgi:hypothetical protein
LRYRAKWLIQLINKVTGRSFVDKSIKKFFKKFFLEIDGKRKKFFKNFFEEKEW